MEVYTGKQVFQLLVKNHSVRGITDEWVSRDIQSDIRIRRAKTRGHTVIETSDVMFAEFVRTWHPECQVNIKTE